MSCFCSLSPRAGGTQGCKEASLLDSQSLARHGRSRFSYVLTEAKTGDLGSVSALGAGSLSYAHIPVRGMRRRGHFGEPGGGGVSPSLAGDLAQSHAEEVKGLRKGFLLRTVELYSV